MVRAAKVKQAAAEKRFKEANSKVGVQSITDLSPLIFV